MRKGLVAVALGITLVPLSVSAVTDAELEAQIQALLTKIATLQKQIGAWQAPVFTPENTPNVSQMSGCPTFTRTLSRGARGVDVANLQSFLARDPAVYTGDITSFFGPLTEEALKKWQSKNNVVSTGDATTTGWGVLGNRTRAAIGALCVKDPLPAQKQVCAPLTQRVSPCVGTWKEIKDENSCTIAWQCLSFGVSTTSAYSCPAYPYPTCSKYEDLFAGTGLANGCQSAPRCVLKNNSSNVVFFASPGFGVYPLSTEFGIAGPGKFRISFGDGAYTGEFDGSSATTPTIKHTYTGPGTFVARLYRDAPLCFPSCEFSVDPTAIYNVVVATSTQ